MRSIEQLIAGNHAYVVDMRHHFRMNPELSGQEHKTQARIIQELKSFGLDPKPVAGTGVMADIVGGTSGKTVAMRADIDALPIQDELAQDYHSRNPGVSHACGHDAHTAMMLGAAKTLAAAAKDLPGRYRVLFQPSEEKIPGGAQPMIEAGVLKGVDTVIGAHVWSPLPFGTIGVTRGALMALQNEFRITIKGKGGHGSMPHQTVDPILIGAQVVLALRSLVGAYVDAHRPLVLTIGKFQSGAVFNVIPSTAELLGTIRSFDASVRDKVVERMDSLCKGICAAYGADYVFDLVPGYPAVINDATVADKVIETAREILGDKGLPEIEPVMGSEDFSYYQEVVPGAYYFIGVGNPAKDAVYPQHHSKYQIDEDALLIGCRMMVGTALKLAAA